MNSRADSRVEEGHQAKIFLVVASLDEFDNRDVIPWLVAGAESMAEQLTRKLALNKLTDCCGH